jgi:DNA-binding NarL/FixJ family response regulator
LLMSAAPLRGPGRGRVAVVMRPAQGVDLASLITTLHMLTDRETEVAQLITSGWTIGEIADHLKISPLTVRDHVKAIFAKFDVRSRAELTATLLQRRTG